MLTHFQLNSVSHRRTHWRNFNELGGLLFDPPRVTADFIRSISSHSTNSRNTLMDSYLFNFIVIGVPQTTP